MLPVVGVAGLMTGIVMLVRSAPPTKPWGVMVSGLGFSAHIRDMTRIPDTRTDGISSNEFCALLPRRRYSHEARGLVLLMPSSGLVVVPFEELSGGGWYAAVVEGHGSYPVGGHHLYISKVEIETAFEVSIGDPLPAVIANNAEEADALEDGVFILTRDHGGLSKKTIDGEIRWTRTILKKVSLRTDEIVDQLPVVVRLSKETASV